MPQQDFVIITGMSGAGKSLAMKCFEDLGYFCADNLPPALIPKFAQLCAASSVERIALVVDIRGREFFPRLQEALNELPQLGLDPFVLFLEATDEVLVRRYKETRRLHPLAANGRVLQAIREERSMLRELRRLAHRILDTSKLSPHQLMTEISSCFGPGGGGPRISVHVMSFGYKYGIPLDADLVLDVRFLPNPYYVDELQRLTGLDEPVKRYLFDHPACREFLERAAALLDFLLPRYGEEGKFHSILAIGCTGGQHRSAALAEALAEHLRRSGYSTSVEHRDLVPRQAAVPP